MPASLSYRESNVMDAISSCFRAALEAVIQDQLSPQVIDLVQKDAREQADRLVLNRQASSVPGGYKDAGAARNIDADVR
jgi:hypothetical protein